MKRKIGKRGVAIIVICVAVVAIAASGLMSGGGEAAMPVETEAARIGTLTQIIAIKGNIEGSDRAEIASAENREIGQIFVKEGDRVSRGDVLAALKDSGAEETDNTHARERAKNSMELAQFEYEAMQTLYQFGDEVVYADTDVYWTSPVRVGNQQWTIGLEGCDAAIINDMLGAIALAIGIRKARGKAGPHRGAAVRIRA